MYSDTTNRINQELAQLRHKQDRFDALLEDVRTAKFKKNIPDLYDQIKKLSDARETPDDETIVLANRRVEQCLDLLDVQLIEGRLPWQVDAKDTTALAALGESDGLPEDYWHLQDILAELVWAWTSQGYENDMLNIWAQCKEEQQCQEC